MRILFVADVSPVKVIGGAERVLREHTVRLARRGHAVFVLTRGMGEDVPPIVSIEGVSVYRLPGKPVTPITLLFSSLWHSSRMFNRVAREIKPDLINFHQPVTALGVLLSPMSWKIPKVYTFHSPSFLEYEIRTKMRGLNWFRRLSARLGILVRRVAEYICLRSCHKVVVLSQFSKQLLRKYHRIPETKVAVIPGGVDTNRFAPPPDRKSMRRALRIPDGRIFLFTLRNLVPRMGLENLLLAMKQLRAVGNDVFLVIGGEGVLEEELKKLAHKLGLEHMVRFEGYISDGDLPMYFQGADYFVLPTRFLEGFGLVTVEALACGTPVLGTPVGGTLEILSGLDPTLLTKGTEPEDIVEVIKQHITDGALARLPQLRKRCRRFAVEHYDWERVIDRLEDVFLNTTEP
ncbi:MAG: glycosyltransferase family 4 protein [Candidatus Latescibacteria bacterium]|nr:glycosyltransferase family 4 protein [Candidatus Latescibacterota bacterium]